MFGFQPIILYVLFFNQITFLTNWIRYNKFLIRYNYYHKINCLLNTHDLLVMLFNLKHPSSILRKSTTSKLVWNWNFSRGIDKWVGTNLGWSKWYQKVSIHATENWICRNLPLKIWAFCIEIMCQDMLVVEALNTTNPYTQLFFF